MSGSRRVLLGILGGLCRPVLQILSLFQTKKYHFLPPFFRPGLYDPYPFSDLEAVTKRIITCSNKTEIMSPLLRLKPQEKDFLKSTSNSHITLLFLFNSFGIETTKTFLNHTRFQTKMGKVYAQKPYPLWRHIPISNGLYKRSTPPPPTWGLAKDFCVGINGRRATSI